MRTFKSASSSRPEGLHYDRSKDLRYDYGRIKNSFTMRMKPFASSSSG